MIWLEPRELVDVSSFRPAMPDRRRSSGAATDAAMVAAGLLGLPNRPKCLRELAEVVTVRAAPCAWRIGGGTPTQLRSRADSPARARSRTWTRFATRTLGARRAS